MKKLSKKADEGLFKSYLINKIESYLYEKENNSPDITLQIPHLFCKGDGRDIYNFAKVA